jgi:hypothetical protein
VNLPVPDVDDPVGALGHSGVVGYHDYSVALSVELIEDLQDVSSGRAVQVAGRLVGQMMEGEFTMGRAKATLVP